VFLPVRLSRLVYCLLVKLKPARVKHISSVPLQGSPLVLPKHMRLDLKGLQRTNNLAYSKHCKLQSLKVLQHYVLVSIFLIGQEK
jgi:hypothetical protein